VIAHPVRSRAIDLPLSLSILHFFTVCPGKGAENPQMNLSLYSVNAFIVLDTDGHRVLAKYYSPKARTQLGEPDLNKGLQNLKEQRAFEKGLFAKTKKTWW